MTSSSQLTDLEDCESQRIESEPLLGELKEQSSKNTGRKADLQEHISQDAMTYSTPELVTWKCFTNNASTVWLKAELWYMMLRLSLVALGTAIVTVLVVPNPAALKVAKFTAVSKFLNVIVGLLLGFFLSSSMNRWHSCVNGYMGLLNTLRNLHIQFLALGVRETDLNNVLRYGYASALFLHAQLETDGQKITTGTCDRNRVWTRVGSKVFHIDPSGETLVLTQKEISVLRTTHDPPHILWTWVGVYLGGLAQEGWIPPMNSPTYGRIMNLCQLAHESIRQVNLAVSVQAPLTYVHTLATLVHINNLLSALTMGIVSGLAVGTALIAHDFHLFKRSPVSGISIGDASMKESERDWQNLVVTFLYCCLGPVLYQGMLMIATYIAQPFQSDCATVPMQNLLQELETDLCESRDSVVTMEFKMPFFKAKEISTDEHCGKPPDEDGGE